MTVRFLDPRAEPGLPAEPYVLRLDPAVEQPVIGFLANRFPGSVEFAGHLGDALAKLLPTAEMRQYAKDDASQRASDQLLDGIAAECHAVITLYGH